MGVAFLGHQYVVNIRLIFNGLMETCILLCSKRAHNVWKIENAEKSMGNLYLAA